MLVREVNSAHFAVGTELIPGPLERSKTDRSALLGTKRQRLPASVEFDGRTLIDSDGVLNLDELTPN